MNIIFLIILLIISMSSFAFEVKPEFLHSGEWNESPLWKQEIDSTCNDDAYKSSGTMPVHEMITARATKKLCINNPNIQGVFFQECQELQQSNNYSSNDPLISGSEFNDDPTGISRRDRPDFLFFLDWFQPRYFTDIMEKEGALTNRSHKGELQFLHAMASECGEPFEVTREKILNYIAENFNLAKNIDTQLKTNNVYALKSLLERPVTQNDYYEFLIGNEGECGYEDFNKSSILKPRAGMTVEKLFSRCGQFQNGNYPEDKFNDFSDDDKIKAKSRAIGLLALGSALHVIQDSYSTSHVRREEKSKDIIKFYHYPNDHHELAPPLHCEHDQYSKQNESAIVTATNKSYAFLLKFIEKNKECNLSDSDENTCKKMIKEWLGSHIFNYSSNSARLKSIEPYPVDTIYPVTKNGYCQNQFQQ